MDAERAADLAREELGLEPLEPINDLIGVIESQGPSVYVLDMGNDGIAGAFHSERGHGFIFANGANVHPLTRRRFTLAHEFGHFRLSHGDQLDETIRFDENAPQVEVEANQFAAAFLVQKAMVQRWASDHPDNPFSFEHLVEFAAGCGVSPKMMCFRFANLACIDDATKDAYLKRIDESREASDLRRKNNWSVVGTETDQARHVPRVPQLLTDAIRALAGREKLNIDRATVLLEGDADAARRLFQGSSGQDARG